MAESPALYDDYQESGDDYDDYQGSGDDCPEIGGYYDDYQEVDDDTDDYQEVDDDTDDYQEVDDDFHDYRGGANHDDWQGNHDKEDHQGYDDRDGRPGDPDEDDDDRYHGEHGDNKSEQNDFCDWNDCGQGDDYPVRRERQYTWGPGSDRTPNPSHDRFFGSHGHGSAEPQRRLVGGCGRSRGRGRGGLEPLDRPVGGRHFAALDFDIQLDQLSTAMQRNQLRGGEPRK